MVASVVSPFGTGDAVLESHMCGVGAVNIGWPELSFAVRFPPASAASVTPDVVTAMWRVERAGLAAAVESLTTKTSEKPPDAVSVT